MSFTELKDRFLRLRHDDLSNEDADRTIDRLGAQAARLYSEYATDGTTGFDTQFCQPKLVHGDVAGNERKWSLCWKAITEVLARTNPGRLPETFGDGRVTPVRKGVYTVQYPPERWRQRCEDHAAACGFLAELVLKAERDAPAERRGALIREFEAIHQEGRERSRDLPIDPECGKYPDPCSPEGTKLHHLERLRQGHVLHANAVRNFERSAELLLSPEQTHEYLAAMAPYWAELEARLSWIGQRSNDHVDRCRRLRRECCRCGSLGVMVEVAIAWLGATELIGMFAQPHGWVERTASGLRWRWATETDTGRKRPRGPNATEQAVIDLLFANGVIGIEALKAIPTDKRPTQERLAKPAIDRTCDGQFKSTLSHMVDLGWLDNGAHHKAGSGYFLTPAGERLATQKRRSGPGPD